MTLEVITAKPRELSNIFIQSVKIDSMDIEYDTKMTENSKYTDDIAVRCTLDIGRDFKPKFYIGGSFKKSPVDNTVEGWYTAYKVRLFFERLGVPLKLQKGKPVHDNRPPDGLEDAFIGESFYRLTYMSTRKNKHGEPAKIDWQQIGDVQKEPSVLRTEFLKAVRDGYVKDFLEPNLDSQTSGTTMANASELTV